MFGSISLKTLQSESAFAVYFRNVCDEEFHIRIIVHSVKICRIHRKLLRKQELYKIICT